MKFFFTTYQHAAKIVQLNVQKKRSAILFLLFKKMGQRKHF